MLIDSLFSAVKVAAVVVVTSEVAVGKAAMAAVVMTVTVAVAVVAAVAVVMGVAAGCGQL